MSDTERHFLNCSLYHRRGIVDGYKKQDKKRNVVFGQNSKRGKAETSIYFIKFFKGDVERKDCKAKLVFQAQHFCGIKEWTEGDGKRKQISCSAIFTKDSDPFVIYSHTSNLIESNDHKSLLDKIRREISLFDQKISYQSWDMYQGDNSNLTLYQLHLTPFTLALTNTNNYNLNHHSWVTFVHTLGDIQDVTQVDSSRLQFTYRNLRNQSTDELDCENKPKLSTMRLSTIEMDNGAKRIIDAIHEALKRFHERKKLQAGTAMQYHFGPVRSNSDPLLIGKISSTTAPGLKAHDRGFKSQSVDTTTSTTNPEIPPKCPSRADLPDKPAPKVTNVSCMTRKVKALPKLPGEKESCIPQKPLPGLPLIERESLHKPEVVKPRVAQRTKIRGQAALPPDKNVESKKHHPPIPRPIIKSQSIDNPIIDDKPKIPTTRKRSFPQDSKSKIVPDVRVLMRNAQADRMKCSIRKSIIAVKSSQLRRSSSMGSIRAKLDVADKSPYVDMYPNKASQSQLKYAIDKCIKAAHIIKSMKKETFAKALKYQLPPTLKEIFKEMADFYEAEVLPTKLDETCISGWDPIYYTLMKKQNRTPMGPDTLDLNFIQRPQLYFRLYDRNGLTKNWKHLADILGLSCEVIDLIESIAFNSGSTFTPAELLFNHWQCLHNKFQNTPFEPKYLCTLENLKAILEKMHRLDLLDMLEETKIATENSKEEQHEFTRKCDE